MSLRGVLRGVGDVLCGDSYICVKGVNEELSLRALGVRPWEVMDCSEVDALKNVEDVMESVEWECGIAWKTCIGGYRFSWLLT
jgi:hypothetical protein